MGIWQYRYYFLYRLLPLFYYLLRFYLFLVRVRVIGEEIALGCLTDYGKIISGESAETTSQESGSSADQTGYYNTAGYYQPDNSGIFDAETSYLSESN